MNWILVLGGRSDIAKATAHTFAQNGFNIYLAARNHQDLENDVKDLQIRHQIAAEAVEFNALDWQSHEGFYNSLQEKPLGVVCLVGYLGDQKSAQQSFHEAEKIINTNFTGCVSILDIVANAFEARGKGFIIAISSVAGDRGRSSNYLYGSAKAGLTAYLSGLRNRLFKSNVQVITVKPGFVATKMTEGMKLPPLLTAEPKQVADDIFRAWRQMKDVVYIRWFWKWIMLIIKCIPEKIFKRTSL